MKNDSLTSQLNTKIALYRNNNGEEENWLGKELKDDKLPSFGRRVTAEIGFVLNTVVGTVETVAYLALTFLSILVTPIHRQPLNWTVKQLKHSAFSTIWSVWNLYRNMIHANLFTDERLAKLEIYHGHIPQCVINGYKSDNDINHTFIEGRNNCNKAISSLKNLHGWKIADLEKKLRPGAESEIGFIGKNESLLELLVKDNKTVHRHRVTHKKIADELSSALEIFGGGDCNGIKKYKGISYRIHSRQSKGWQDNPFQKKWERLITSSFQIDISRLGMFGLPVVTVTNVTEMLPQLIKDYGFYEGETPYRVSPEDLIELFQLEAKPKTVYGWENAFSRYRLSSWYQKYRGRKDS